MTCEKDITLKSFFRFMIAACFLLLTACGFHPQGEMPLAPPLHKMYVKTQDPYGYLARNLQLNLKLSKVQLTDSPSDATTILAMTEESMSQEELSVSGTQQTRQYNLKITIAFEITDHTGKILVPSQSLSETRTITIQSNQILGSSNEANLLYQQMRRALAYSIMYRISSKEITKMIIDGTSSTAAKKHS
ncbi:MAG: hypothetical protein ACD_46C00162G0002 [uncultured bacterium]|nr:MAG: hypothetical protein ACD_46C00162G0002 [uncultured bacterium]